MVLGQADGPLLDRQFDHFDTQATLVVQALLLPGLAEHERACIRRIGQEVVDRPIARPRPSDPALTDCPARQLLPLIDQLNHHLPRRTLPSPEREHPLDREPDLLISAEHDPVILVAV